MKFLFLLLFLPLLFADSDLLRKFEKNTNITRKEIVTKYKSHLKILNHNLKNSKNQQQKTQVMQQIDALTLQIELAELEFKKKIPRVKLSKGSLSSINLLIENYNSHLDKFKSNKTIYVKGSSYSLCQKRRLSGFCDNQAQCQSHFKKMMSSTSYFKSYLNHSKSCFQEQSRQDFLAISFCTLEGLYFIKKNKQLLKQYKQHEYKLLQALNDLGAYCLSRDYNFDQSIFKYWVE